MNDKIFPIPQTNMNNEISREIRELENIYQSMDEKLGDLMKKRESLLQTDAKTHPDLENKIIEYLTQMGESNEFLICKDLGSNIQTTYETLCNLQKNEIVIQTEDLNWKIIKKI